MMMMTLKLLLTINENQCKHSLGFFLKKEGDWEWRAERAKRRG